MFGLGLGEILIIGICIIIFIAPSDLPKLIRKVGDLYRNITQVYTSLQRELNTLNALEDDSSQKPKDEQSTHQT